MKLMKCHYLRLVLLALINISLVLCSNSSSFEPHDNLNRTGNLQDNSTSIKLEEKNEELTTTSEIELCRGEWKYPAKCSGFGCDYKVTWEYQDESDEIAFTVSTKNRNKWTGIGFSHNQAMPETDAVLGLVEESGRFFMMDTWFDAYEVPPLDQEQNIYNMTAWRENGITTLKFFRKRTTGDLKDFQFTDTNCPYFIFPIQGGLFNAVNKRIRKHEQTPIISDNRICVKSCKTIPIEPTQTQPKSSTQQTPQSGGGSGSQDDHESDLSDMEFDHEYNDNNDKSLQTTPSIVLTQTSTMIKSKANQPVNRLHKYKVEIKLPQAWKPTMGQRQSEDYVKLMENVKKYMNEELIKNLLLKNVDVLELTGVQEEANSVIARMELLVDETNQTGTLDSILKELIKNEQLGSLQVDPKYLMVARSEQKDDLFGDKDKSKSKWSIFFELNDEQLKWVIIIGGVTALVILVVIQALCMVWKDGKNKERKPTAKDKQAPNSHWKDYAQSNGAYGYDNYGADDPDGFVKSNIQTCNESSNGKASRQSANQHQNSNKHHHHGNRNGNNDKLASSYQNYQSATLERNLSRDIHQYRNHGNYPSVYATQDRRDPYYRQQTPHQTYSSHPLQPDFYFMPHQRRYSGEVVRVFVDYNNPQYIPK